MLYDKIYNSFIKLADYCESESFKGYDPYDGLNSTLFKKIPVVNKFKLIRLCWIQFFKKSPFNFRNIAFIKSEYNPKAMGLFLSSYCNWYKLSPDKSKLDKIDFFLEKIISLKSNQYSNSCWGYNFDWQSRAFYQPAYTPNIVTSCFVANSLLDLYDLNGNDNLLIEARSTCNFILYDLNKTTDDKGDIAFSYTPLDNSIVFNASLLGARLLARVFSKTKEEKLMKSAQSAVKFCCSYQKNNGAWNYGTLPFHQWEDNFHTGYNLECIADYMYYTKDYSFDQNLSNGFNYYICNFFRNDGAPKYYSNSLYPIDIHSSSQLVITLCKLNKIESEIILVGKLMNWTIDNMQSDKGFFYYQKKKWFTIKISYMRWSQAWMMLSMSHYLTHFKN